MHMNKLKPILFLVLITVVTAPAGVFAREAVIPFTETTLENGLRVIVHEDTKAPIVSVNVWYHVGSKNEKEGKTGFAHLFEHLMFYGSENFKGVWFEPMERVGATNINGTTNTDRTNYFQDVPKTALDMTLFLESDRMGHLLGAIDQELLDTQRGVVQNEKRQSENQPYGTVWERVARGVFPPGHPYSWMTIGSMEDLNAASLEDVKEWFRTYYGPNNAVIVIAGDVKAEEAIAKVEKYFGDIPPGPPLTKPGVWLPDLVGEKREIMQDRVPQARIYKVWVAPEWVNEDLVALDLATTVLGGGKNSRLYQRLVYEDQIATDANAYIWPGEIASRLVLQATAQNGVDLAKVEKVLDEELEKFLKKGPDKKELERVKTEDQAAFVRGVERVGGKSDVLAENAVYAGDPGFYQVTNSRKAAATPKQVREVSNRWFGKGNYVLEVHPYPQVSAAETGVDRSTIPMPETFPEVEFDKFQRDTLSNGMEIIVAERHAVPVVNFQLLLDAGYASDQFAVPGTSSMAMAMLDEGTKKRSANDISLEVSRLGSNLGAGSSLDSSFVYINSLTDKVDDSLNIFADVILNPAFPQQELDRLKKMRLAQIQREKVTPVPLALRVLPELLYGEGHAYATPLTGSGTEESLEKLDRDLLMEYHQTWFKPNNGTMIVVGDTTLEEIKPKLEKYFGGWRQGEIPEKNIPSVNVAEKETIYLINRPESQQSLVIAGHIIPPMNNPNEMAIQGMNRVLGGDFSARINMNLREDKHWAYGAYSFIIDAKAQRLFGAYAQVQSDKTAESMQELRREIADIQTTKPPTEKELNTVHDSLVLSLPGRWETASAVNAAITDIEQYGLDDNYWNEYADEVKSLTLQDLRNAADSTLHPDKLVWVVVGDRKLIEPEIRKLGYGDVVILDDEGNPAE